MRTAIALSSFIILLVLGACNTPQNADSSTMETSKQEVAAVPHPGENLFMAYCFSCHNNNATKDSRIAPPVFAIQKRYKMEYDSKEEFTKAIIAFTSNPNDETALMLEAVKKFGVMPQMSYDKSDLQLLADYIYEGDFTHPGNKSENKQNNGQGLNPMQRGKFVSKSTKATLGKNLMAAIKNKGTEGAISFCNLHAISITNSMTNEMGVKSIQRVSDKARNPQNIASQEEVEYIHTFKTSAEKGEDFTPIVNDLGKEYVFYAPIITNKLCMQCHGKADQIKPEVSTRINQLYPADQGIGYTENQVRGMWKVVMTKG